MPDDPRIPRDDEDAAFREWMRNRPNDPENVPASVTFMEIMRQAAARSSPDQPVNAMDENSQSPDPKPPQRDPDATTPYASPEDRPKRRRTPPPLTSADISAAVRAAGEEFTRAADSTPSTDALGAPSPKPPAAPPAEPERPPTQTRRRRFERSAAQGEPPIEPQSTGEAAPASPVSNASDNTASGSPTDAETPPQVGTSPAVSEFDIPTDAPATDPDATIPDSPDAAAIRAEMRKRLIEQRRARAQQRQRPASAIGGFIRSFILVFAAAGLIATIFTWWTPPRFINQAVSAQLSAAMETNNALESAQPANAGTSVIPTPNWALRIGIVSGHRGNDSGAVCDDGLREVDINFSVATEVVQNLRNVGYTVDLLDEFDPRLNNYNAVALVSIHANSCQDYGYRASGYLIAAAAARVNTRSVDDLLVECIARNYQAVSGLERLPGVTVDMTDYHAFREIGANTPAAIIELGFMRADRELLVNYPAELARAISDGVLCFVEPARNVLAPTATPTVTPEATEPL